MKPETRHYLKRQLRPGHNFGVRFVGIIVAAHSLFILATSLLSQTILHSHSSPGSLLTYLPILVGLSLLYLSYQLRSQKRTAWVATVVIYSLYLIIGLVRSSLHNGVDDLLESLLVIRSCILPALILIMLYANRSKYVVRSDIQSFRGMARFSLLVLVVAFIYGVIGFSLLDNTDFHQEIGTLTAAHYTIDQFDLTTAQPLHAYTKRAGIFLNSLSLVSILAVGYAILALFQPLKMRLGSHDVDRQRLHDLLTEYPATSEDFFKIWPHDKLYFFDDQQHSALTFHVNKGVALCLGDPSGDPKFFNRLLTEFDTMCFGNDWLPAMIHVEDKHRKLYERQGYNLQKIGQEAVVDIAHFQSDVANNKYFRHITNKFTKQGFTSELLTPPHHAAIVDRLQQVSNEWLHDGGRVERGFAMGYFTLDYIQQCPVMVVRDAAGTIQAFMNQLPADFDKVQATYDMLRHTRSSLGNINDFLLMNFISSLATVGYQQLNLGLCPLVGLAEQDEDKKTLIDSVLRFAYSNGDRFYSFSGLYRFKTKYEPMWSDRYIAYQSGITGFTRTTNALMSAMRVKHQK